MNASAERIELRKRKDEQRPAKADAEPAAGPARLYALLAGAFLALLGVLGFFYDASFGTGENLASDDLAGLLNINGWRNVIYIATGVAALAFAPRHARRTAFGLGLFYFVFAIWGFDQTERDIGNLLDAIPLGDKDNALHLALGVLGLGAALVDGPLPKLPERVRTLPGKTAKPLIAAGHGVGGKLKRKPKPAKSKTTPKSGLRSRTRKPTTATKAKAEMRSKTSKPKGTSESKDAGTEAKPAKRELPRPRPRQRKPREDGGGSADTSD